MVERHHPADRFARVEADRVVEGVHRVVAVGRVALGLACRGEELGERVLVGRMHDLVG